MGVRGCRKRPSDHDQPQTWPQSACSPKHWGFSRTSRQTHGFPGPGLQTQSQQTLTCTFTRRGEGGWFSVSSSGAPSGA